MELEKISELVKSAVQEAISNIYPHKEWLSKKEAANYANCSTQKIDQLIRSGEIIASNKGVKGVTVSISKSSINNYFKKNIYVPAKDNLLELLPSGGETANPKNQRRGRTRQAHSHIKVKRLSSHI